MHIEQIEIFFQKYKIWLRVVICFIKKLDLFNYQLNFIIIINRLIIIIFIIQFFEYEFQRIYNNCKTAFNSELLSEDDIRAGVFRTTEYNNSEINNILSLDFVSQIYKDYPALENLNLSDNRKLFNFSCRYM